MRRLIATLAVLAIVVTTVPAYADNAAGKITIVQTSSNGTRFFMQAQGLSLFTTSAEHRDLLLGAFFRKANLNVSYTKITCTGGITGTCGTVNFVSVDASGIP